MQQYDENYWAKNRGNLEAEDLKKTGLEVHHAIPQEALKLFGGVYSASALNDYNNLRGTNRHINGSIMKRWQNFQLFRIRQRLFELFKVIKQKMLAQDGETKIEQSIKQKYQDNAAMLAKAGLMFEINALQAKERELVARELDTEDEKTKKEIKNQRAEVRRQTENLEEGMVQFVKNRKEQIFAEYKTAIANEIEKQKQQVRDENKEQQVDYKKVEDNAKALKTVLKKDPLIKRMKLYLQRKLDGSRPIYSRTSEDLKDVVIRKLTQIRDELKADTRTQETGDMLKELGDEKGSNIIMADIIHRYLESRNTKKGVIAALRVCKHQTIANQVLKTERKEVLNNLKSFLDTLDSNTETKYGCSVLKSMQENMPAAVRIYVSDMLNKYSGKNDRLYGQQFVPKIKFDDANRRIETRNGKEYNVSDIKPDLVALQ